MVILVAIIHNMYKRVWMLDECLISKPAFRWRKRLLVEFRSDAGSKYLVNLLVFTRFKSLKSATHWSIMHHQCCCKPTAPPLSRWGQDWLCPEQSPENTRLTSRYIKSFTLHSLSHSLTRFHTNTFRAQNTLTQNGQHHKWTSHSALHLALAALLAPLAANITCIMWRWWTQNTNLTTPESKHSRPINHWSDYIKRSRFALFMPAQALDPHRTVPK